MQPIKTSRKWRVVSKRRYTHVAKGARRRRSLHRRRPYLRTASTQRQQRPRQSRRAPHGRPNKSPRPPKQKVSRWCVLPSQQRRQLRDVGGDAPGLVAGEEVRRRTPARLLLEIDIGERLTVGVADDEAGVHRFDGPGWQLALKAPHQ